MHLLKGVVRPYAWGSRTALAQLTGRPVPSPHPEAELWMGAHPADPAFVVDDGGTTSLLEVLRSDPRGQLGADCVDRFGERLPFLLKVLAADEPLSLQAHPSLVQAIEGYRREERFGVPLDSPIRNYKDQSHKPELVVALSRFEALAGFRNPARTIDLLTALQVPSLERYLGLLRGQLDSAGLRALFTTWITLPPPTLHALVPQVLDGCVEYLSRHPKSAEFVAETQTTLELGEAYPGDAGVLASLLLNRVSLEPGEGLYLAAGNLHSYLRGVGVEIMANSDNVLRGGLTPKHVDVPELLRVLDFADTGVGVLVGEPTMSGNVGELRYRTPASEFALSRIELEGTALHRSASIGLDHWGPQILLCTAGSVVLRCGDKSLALGRGESAWLSASDPDVLVHAEAGYAQVFRATVGQSADQISAN